MARSACVRFTFRLFVVACLVLGGIWAGTVEYQLVKLSRATSQLRWLRVGMSEEDIRAHQLSDFTVISTPERMKESPYNAYEQSARSFPDHIIVTFIDEEMAQAHCDEEGRVECVFWGRRKR